MTKTFTRAGTSQLHGVVAYRFANDLQRETVLAKTGHTDIRLIELGKPMTKSEAIAYLADQGVQAQTGSVRNPNRTLRLARASRNPTEDTGPVDLFVEPKDERVQVAMSRLARQYPGMSAENLLLQVQLTHKEFGDYEPNF